MHKLLAFSIGLGLTISAAQAMNREGHDEWMADFPYAVEFEAQVTPGRRVPREMKPCVPEAMIGKVPANVYEQVPLRKHACKAGEGAAPSPLLLH